MYVIVIKVNFIDRKHTQILENGKNKFLIFFLQKRSSCVIIKFVLNKHLIHEDTASSPLPPTEVLDHVAVVVATHAFDLLLRGRLRHLEHQRRLAEPQVLRRHKAIQEDVDACNHHQGVYVLVSHPRTQCNDDRVCICAPVRTIIETHFFQFLLGY